MKIEVTTAKQHHRFGEPFTVRVVVKNDGATHLEVLDWLTEHRFRVEGHDADGGSCFQANPRPAVLNPGAMLTIEQTYEHDAASLVTSAPSVVRLGLELEGTVVVDGRPHTFASGLMSVEVDLSRVGLLRTDGGDPSCYVAENDEVFYVSSKSRAYEARTAKLGVNVAAARVVSRDYLIDDHRVFYAGRLRRNVSPVGFRVLNSIFAGNEDVILTTYGDAKVDDPSTFEVLDDGRNTWGGRRVGYGGGYGRDAESVYYFTEETSTPHAIRLKACADPKSFESLPCAHGRDAEHVYSEATRIGGADPRTWRMLNCLHSLDARKVFYGTQRIRGADPATFEVLPDPASDSTERSLWGRDARSYFERHEPRTAEAYLAAQRAR